LLNVNQVSPSVQTERWRGY